jgi:hypothetical protein
VGLGKFGRETQRRLGCDARARECLLRPNIGVFRERYQRLGEACIGAGKQGILGDGLTKPVDREPHLATLVLVQARR